MGGVHSCERCSLAWAVFTSVSGVHSRAPCVPAYVMYDLNIATFNIGRLHLQHSIDLVDEGLPRIVAENATK